jgi:Tfp pilus assembly protein PilF
MRYAFVLAALLAGCATVERPAEAPPEPPAAPEAPAARVSENVAVAQLVQGARGESEAGQHAKAAASLERALRIEPRNARLWQELARVRLRQREYAQAESVASRSNSWAGADAALRSENWRIIAEARGGRGDAEGARAALEQADRVR